MLKRGPRCPRCRPYRTNLYKSAAAQLVLEHTNRLGYWCPGLPPAVPEHDTPPGTLTVDHIDNDPLNNDPNNMRVLCNSCNNKARHLGL